MLDKVSVDFDILDLSTTVDGLALQLYAAISNKDASLVGVYTTLESIENHENEDTSPLIFTLFTVTVQLEPEQIKNWKSYNNLICDKALHELAGEGLELTRHKNVYSHLYLYFVAKN